MFSCLQPPPNPYGRSFDPAASAEGIPFLRAGDVVTPRKDDEVRKRIVAGLRFAVEYAASSEHLRDRGDRFGLTTIEEAIEFLDNPDLSVRDWLRLTLVDKMADRTGEPFPVAEDYACTPSESIDERLRSDTAHGLNCRPQGC